MWLVIQSVFHSPHAGGCLNTAPERWRGAVSHWPYCMWGAAEQLERSSRARSCAPVLALNLVRILHSTAGLQTHTVPLILVCHKVGVWTWQCHELLCSPSASQTAMWSENGRILQVVENILKNVHYCIRRRDTAWRKEWVFLKITPSLLKSLLFHLAHL